VEKSACASGQRMRIAGAPIRLTTSARPSPVHDTRGLGDRTSAAPHGGRLAFYGEAELFEGPGQVITYAAVVGRSQRVRAPGDLLHVRHRPLGREFRGGCARRSWRRGAAEQDTSQAQAHDECSRHDRCRSATCCVRGLPPMPRFMAVTRYTRVSTPGVSIRGRHPRASVSRQSAGRPPPGPRRHTSG